MYSRAWLR